MFSPRNFLGLFLTSLLLVSCSPYPRNHGTQPAPNPNTVPDATPVVTPKTPAELKKEADKENARIKANKEAAERRARLREKEAEEKTNNPTVTPPKVTKPEVKKSKFPTALPIPGKPGFVFNPWTNKAVDVRAVPSGYLVRDPGDGNPDHKFRVP
jgi:hypothetical protein